jgi:uncharacterized protein (TIGR04141 family)
MAREKSIQLKILLLKQEIESFEAALKEPNALDTHALNTELSFEGTIYIKRPTTRFASWIDFLQQGTTDKVNPCQTATAASVLFIETGNRKFALTFGYGRNLLHADCYERGFGLRVVLNTVDPSSVRSLDIKTFEDLTLATRRQASRASNLGTFGLDIRKDLLNAVIGKPKDENFAKQIAGSDSLTISLPIEFNKLGDKCQELLNAYASADYKENFGFIDYFKAIRDKSEIRHLEETFINDINTDQLQSMHLAPPEPIDWENVSGFTYSLRKNAQVYSDLDIDEMLNEIDGSEAGLTIDKLKRKYISVRYRESEASINKWSIYSCIVYETDIDNRLE